MNVLSLREERRHQRAVQAGIGKEFVGENNQEPGRVEMKSSRWWSSQGKAESEKLCVLKESSTKSIDQ